MDIPICLERLGRKPEVLHLTQSVPPHTIVEWIGGDPQPTQEELETCWTEYLAEQELEKVNNLRKERNRLLAETDWVITMHKELGTNIPAAWKTYRQALRDLPANTEDPANPVWPTKPS